MMTDVTGQQSLFDEIDLEELEASKTPTDDRADWEKEWSAIRVPAELKERIESLRDRMAEHYAKTGKGLPEGASVDGQTIALHWLITKALDKHEDHLNRSKRNRRHAT